MSEKLMEIAARIKSLREILGISEQDAAKRTGISTNEYKKIEKGEVDFSATFIISLADFFGVETTDILTGKSPTLSTYAVGRNGEGLEIERREGFRYRSFAHNFKNKQAECFYVTAPYNEASVNESITLSKHEGQEFDYVLSGSLKIQIGDKTEILNAGDSIYYDSSNGHGMIAVGGKDCHFLAVLIKKC